ncbi:MAG: DUF177 domain-containing protein [Chitinophagaceae bacterium]
MKHKREYEIAFVGLKPGLHFYNFQIDSKFFEHFEQTDFTNPQLDVKLNLDKKSGIFLLHFEINGKITLPCDRCNEEMEWTVWDEFDLVVKIIPDEEVEQKASIDAEVAYIGRSESILDVSGWIYEFIVLSIPMQRIHPLDQQNQSTCNPAILKYLVDHQPTENASLKNELEKIKKKA